MTTVIQYWFTYWKELTEKRKQYYFDPHQAIKVVRNNILKYDFRWGNKRVNRKHIKFMYEKDRTLRNKLALYSYYLSSKFCKI